MKTSFIVVIALALVGCARLEPRASLTAEQAKALAMQLANDKAKSLYQCQPFRDGQPARLVAGHWVWTSRQGFGRGDIQARVELAADGSAQMIDLTLLDSGNLLF